MYNPYTQSSRFINQVNEENKDTNAKFFVCQIKWFSQHGIFSADSTLEWFKVFKNLFQIEAIKFCWCAYSMNVVMEPPLVMFNDGSKEALAKMYVWRGTYRMKNSCFQRPKPEVLQ